MGDTARKASVGAGEKFELRVPVTTVPCCVNWSFQLLGASRTDDVGFHISMVTDVGKMSAAEIVPFSKVRSPERLRRHNRRVL
jgi:hypothetical protein